MYKGIKYFRKSEMQCKCGCETGADEMNGFLLRSLDLLRSELGRAVIVSSAYRCESHNRNVGGVKSSSHTKGLAVDIIAISDFERFRVVNVAMELGFCRIGIGSSFVHLDIDDSKAMPRMWVY